MLRIDIIAVGRMKKGPLPDLCAEYRKRITWPLALYEIDGKNQEDEAALIKKKIHAGSFVFALDERGKSLTSRDFSKKLADISARNGPDIQFIVGGADGLTDDLRSRANFLLAFGPQTWPHRLAQVMLLEQIYRAQQILSGHPYHRD